MASGYSDLSEIRKNGRPFGGYPKPPKIDLINETPRRDSVVEQQLNSNIIRPIESYQQVPQQASQGGYGTQVFNNQQQMSQRSQLEQSYLPSASPSMNCGNQSSNYGNSAYGSTNIAPMNCNNIDQFQQQPAGNKKVITTTVTTTTNTSDTNGLMRTKQQQPRILEPTMAQTINNQLLDQQRQREYLEVTKANYQLQDLMEREAKLRKEIAYLNLYQNPWSRPKQIREPRREPEPKTARNDQRWVREFPTSRSTSRPNSRASSTRSTTEADLFEKAEKLLKDVEEIERKPLKMQQILVESGANRSGSGNYQTSGDTNNVSSIQTKIINVPTYEIDNKSPLPFAYDNFSTLGVRGNIASFGAAEPEKPYAPIFPLIKKTPSPTGRRR